MVSHTNNHRTTANAKPRSKKYSKGTKSPQVQSTYSKFKMYMGLPSFGAEAPIGQAFLPVIPQSHAGSKKLTQSNLDLA